MNLLNTAKAFGCHDVVLLDGEPTPKHLDYLDLLKVTENKGLRVDAVAEFQARPLLYIVNSNQMQNTTDEHILNLQCLLANRGERAYLGILSPGELNVYPLNLKRSDLNPEFKRTINNKSPDTPLFFQKLISGVFTIEGQPETSDYVFNTIHKLMSHSSEILIEKYKLNPLNVLSFLGRALFFRFLWDREIVRQNELASICPNANSRSDCFSNITNSVATCKWLDETFNGDLLPFSSSYTTVFREASNKSNQIIFTHLQAILEGWEHVGDGAYQTQIDWGDLDFAHIPIGVLSQVYENFSRVWDSQESKQTSVYYTPKNIARYLVDDAFEGVEDKNNVQILDPSCGAGIFLVLAFRKLVAARWKHDKKRPDTRTIQSILYKQLCGFDVSESALRLAALSLYITAIELNGSPRPPKSLKFPKPLQGVVLHNHRKADEKNSNGFVLGSLRSDLSKDFNGRFDMVVGNPPWSRLRGNKEETDKLNATFTKLTRQSLTDRGFHDIAKTYKNPDKNPDLPFIWRATQWVKPDGIIALALPGRIFLKQSPSGILAFNAILKGIEITGILNGSNLSDSAAWPGMNQPFMLFFARNRVPATNHHFYFVTPHFEKNLNNKGRIRIDYQSAQPIPISDALKNDHLLKTLAVGTSLDLEVIRKLDNLKWPTIKSYWKEQKMYSGRGYDLSLKQIQSDASFMHGLPDFNPPANNSFHIDVSLLDKFPHLTAARPKCIELYTPPLLIVPQSPGSSQALPKSWIAHKSVVFSQSYYGFSAHGNNEADIIITLLHLITHSDLFRYYVLATSSRFGAERRTFIMENIGNFPFPIINTISKTLRKKAIELSKQLETSSDKPWGEINKFIFNIYGLNKYDRQVIKDTLEVASPFKQERDYANSIPNINARKAYFMELQRLLAPSFSVTNETIAINELNLTGQDNFSPWYFFTISSSISSELLQDLPTKLITKITKEANKTGCSRVIVHEDGLLLIGIIGQYRYWTLSRARLCAMEILQNHLNVFPVEKN